jgi:ABC-type lipoprotein release transport system permease subunit
MRPLTLVVRSLIHYRRTHLAALLGVATAVAVLGGALVVGDSVRASLRDLVLRRLGATTHALLGPRFFAEDLGERMTAAEGSGLRTCPLIALRGTVTEAGSGRRASNVLVYGVDARFAAFHGIKDPGLGPREALVSGALAAELGATGGTTVLVRVERTADVSAATLFGRRDDSGRTLRVQVKAVANARALGEFALAPGQQAVKAIFLPLRLAQKALGRDRQANTLLFAAAGPSPDGVSAALGRTASLEDLGLRVRALPARALLSVESDGGLLDEATAEAARQAAAGLSWRSTPVLTYLANSLRHGAHEVPYSLVAGLGPPALAEVTGHAEEGAADSIVLGEWAAHDLDAKPGDPVELDYYLWREEGAIETRTARFTVEAIVPLAGAAADRDLAPAYPGITDSLHLSDWDPPFPVDLDKVRPRDEDYWRDHRTTPKAFLPLARAQELWGHRLGRASSVRVWPAAGASLEEARSRYAAAFRARLDPARFGMSVQAVRADGLAAALGSTDFGEYFVYFSFFLVVSALLLAGLFFRLGVEQRLPEVGLLEAVGWSARRIRRLLVAEGLAVALLGSLIGAALAGGYAQLVLLGLRTIWRGAVGTDRLTLHVGPVALASAVLGGLATAALVIVGALRTLRGLSPRALLTGGLGTEATARRARRRASGAAWGFAALGGGLALGGALGRVAAEGAFFGAGACLLASGLSFAWHGLTRRSRSPVTGLVGLGLRSASHRPGRSLLCIALVAAACFVVVAVGAFQHGAVDVTDPKSGAGGNTLLAESLLPLTYAFDTPAGRDALNLADAEASAVLLGVHVTRFRLKPGDDASCQNLYRPKNPRVLGARADFLSTRRFSFAEVRAQSPEQQANPWLVLEQRFADGAIPAIADQNSIAYVLHSTLGGDVVVDGGQGPVRLRLVAALQGSLFQSELIVSETDFLRVFPAESGYRFFLIEAPPARAAAVTTLLESRLADFGFDVSPTAERLAAYFAVENAYLSTFQALGGLGLLLGTVGLGAVLLRNAFERRRELALERAVGFGRGSLRTVILAENLLLLLAGLGLGTIAALVAVAPAALHRGGALPLGLLGVLLLAVAAAGLVASLAAVSVVARWPLLQSLRAE